MEMNKHRFKLLYKIAWNWLFDKIDELKKSNKSFTLEQREKLLEELKNIKFVLEKISLELEGEKIKNAILNRIITEKLATKNITFVCKNCTFRGKQYHDFCPGCGKDGSGKSVSDYQIISHSNTDNDK